MPIDGDKTSTEVFLRYVEMVSILATVSFYDVTKLLLQVWTVRGEATSGGVGAPMNTCLCVESGGR